MYECLGRKTVLSIKLLVGISLGRLGEELKTFYFYAFLYW